MRSLEEITKEIEEKETKKPKAGVGRLRGLKGGRKGPTAEHLDQLKRLIEVRDKYGQQLYSVPDICGFMRISRNTYYRWLRFMKEVESKTSSPS